MIRYRDTLAAGSTFTVLNCAGSHGSCHSSLRLGTFTHRDRAGVNSLRFSGRLHGHALAPGRYLLTVTATLTGQRSPAITTSFVILAPPTVCNDPDHDGDCDATAHTAATPSCGVSRIDLSNALYGTSSNPAFVLADVPQAQNTGQPLTLAHPGNSNPGEDFTISLEGPVTDFIQAGLIASGMTPYDSLEAYEIEYAPFGAGTGLCVGVPTTPADGTRVDLEPCGVSAKTVWIPDSTNPITTTDAPLINGATDNNFSDPYVLSTLLPGLPLLPRRCTIFPDGLLIELGGRPSQGCVLLGVGRELERPLVGGACAGAALESPEKVGARGVVVGVVTERLAERAQLEVGDLGTRGHRDGDQAVQLSDGRRGQADERVI